MKKSFRKVICLLCFVFLFMLCCCTERKSNNNDPSSATSQPSSNFDKNDNIIDSEVNNEFDLRYGTVLETEAIQGELEKRFGIYPSAIYVDNEFKKIGWVFEGFRGWCVCDENNAFKFDELSQGFTYYDAGLKKSYQEYATLYFGEMSKIYEGVYSVDGTFCPTSELKNQYKEVRENVDFFVIIKDDMLTILLDDLSESDFLNDIVFSSYFLKEK